MLLTTLCSPDRPLDKDAIHSYFESNPAEAAHELLFDAVFDPTYKPPFVVICCSRDAELIDKCIAVGADLNKMYHSYFHPFVYILAASLDTALHVIKRHGSTLDFTKELVEQVLSHMSGFGLAYEGSVRDVFCNMIQHLNTEALQHCIQCFFLLSGGDYFLVQDVLDDVRERHAGCLRAFKPAMGPSLNSHFFFRPRKNKVVCWWNNTQTLLMLATRYQMDVCNSVHICNMESFHRHTCMFVLDVGCFLIDSMTADELRKMTPRHVLMLYHTMNGTARHNPEIVARYAVIRRTCMRMYRNFIAKKYHPDSDVMNDMISLWASYTLQYYLY